MSSMRYFSNKHLLLLGLLSTQVQALSPDDKGTKTLGHQFNKKKAQSEKTAPTQQKQSSSESGEKPPAATDKQSN
ncbi:MAG: hypothetical protein ACPGR2_10580 [Psychrobium sp.]